MKYSYSWLKDYYQSDDTPERTAEILVGLGSEVEEISGGIDDKIVVAKILEIKPHPNADRLHLATIDFGSDQIEIVCGAPNIEVGQSVAYAQIGAKVLDFEIQEAVIRGVKSPGMLLSPRELGLSKDHRGVYLFGDDVVPGTKVAQLLSADSVLDLEITPNRGDLLSHLGLARDLSAKKMQTVQLEAIELTESNERIEDYISVESKTDLCSLYLCRVIRGVKIGPSPDWLVNRLTALGGKSINNVVDVTNYIMLDLGHPLHAFDGQKISSKKIEITEIENDCDVVTLDGEARVMLEEMVAITDSQMPIAIAGVMGLLNSEVDEQTRDIVLEAAVFDPKSIRKTRRALGIQTEASYRFERGVDDAGTQYALDKAAKLIQEVAGGEILKGIAESGQVAQSGAIEVKYEKINDLLGENIAEDEVNAILRALEFKVKDGKAVVPSYRHDIKIWQDLVEEVARIHGLEKLPRVQLSQSQVKGSSIYRKKESIKDFLINLGIDETINYTFLSQQDTEAAKIDPSDLVEVANPVQDENRYLRNSLVPGLLKAVAKNPSFDDIELFEIGMVFSGDKQWNSLAIVCSGKSARAAQQIADELVTTLKIPKNKFNFYEISSDELNRFKIKKPKVSVAEINLDEIIESIAVGDSELKINQDAQYRPISKFPPVKRDLAFVLDEKIASREIQGLILKVCEKAVLVEQFDEFISNRLGEGKKSVAFHIYLEDEQKTLSDAEAEEQIAKIIASLEKEFSAKIRS